MNFENRQVPDTCFHNPNSIPLISQMINQYYRSNKIYFIIFHQTIKYMEKKSKMPMVYGYIVCLVAVITFLVTITTLVTSIMDLTDPIHADTYVPAGTPSLASFENYKMDILKSPDKELSYTPDDITLKAMYDAAREDKISGVKHRANRSILVSGLLIIISVTLFLTHWFWVRRMTKAYNNE